MSDRGGPKCSCWPAIVQRITVEITEIELDCIKVTIRYNNVKL